jgi:hypothetical protein
MIFMWTHSEDYQRPLCAICCKTLWNESLKHTKIRQNLRHVKLWIILISLRFLNCIGNACLCIFLFLSQDTTGLETPLWLMIMLYSQIWHQKTRQPNRTFMWQLFEALHTKAPGSLLATHSFLTNKNCLIRLWSTWLLFPQHVFVKVDFMHLLHCNRST